MIEPMDNWKLEDIQVKAEFPSVGITGDVTKEEFVEMANDVMDLCAEIKRLRYTYGEPYWRPVGKTDDEIADERRMYEARVLNQKNENKSTG